uniref:PKD domain-containing protein n=1 Tax=Nocardioides sp. TaxID=35761 RepID=UPI002B26D519
DAFFDVSGTLLYPERITDGVYNLPGQTQYYGADANGSALVGALAGVGALQNIDSGCGPTGKLVRDAAALADPEIDYSDFDTDKDGVVDFFMVVYAGCGGNGASQLGAVACDNPSDAVPYDNIWPHSSSLEGSYSDPVTGLAGFVTDDQLKDLEGNPLWYTDTSYSTKTTVDKGDALKVFVRVGPYNVNPETAIDKASVISHEYGHSLGLPDFYSTGGRDTYGDWNLMATDKSQNMDAFSRQELGWVVPQVLTSGKTDVSNFKNSKFDTGSITWETPDGAPYTLKNGVDGIVRNSEMYVAKLPGRTLLDSSAFESGEKATPSHLWWSGSGNDFGCVPTGGRNLDIAIPGLRDLPKGTPIDLTFKSRWNIEWDYDYGFVLTTTDGGSTYTSHESEEGYTTSATGVPVGNPNQVGCLSTYDNGLTGSSGSYEAGTQDVDRLAGETPEPVFLTDSYDLTSLAGSDQGALRFSYATDPGLALPGWFIDDVVVTATVDGKDKVLFSTDFETSGQPGDDQIFNGGCKEDLTTASRCTLGWKYLQAGADSPQDHAYYLEMRDRSGFDFDGKGEIDRDAIGFEAGLSLVYTDEAHGYGNAGTDDPPAQSPLDATPTPGSSTPELNDAAFTPAETRRSFSDAKAKPHVDNYEDPSSESGNWTFDYDCLDFTVTSMSGQDAAAVSNLTGDVTFDLGAGCGDFNYGYEPEVVVPENVKPTAVATANPSSATTGQTVSFSGLGSTDDTTAIGDLDFSWDFGDGGSTKDASGATVSRAFNTAGTYQVTLTVTDAQGLNDKVTVPVTVTGDPVVNTAPSANASADPSTVDVGESVALSAAGSTDNETPNGIIYSWDFGDGGSTQDATGRDVDTTYDAPGEYDATVTVTDPEGLSDTATVTVTVNGVTPPVDTTDPTAVAKVSPQKVFVKRAVTLDASGSSDDTSASDDLTYSWSKGDGGDDVDATGEQATVKFTQPGRYTVTLTVTDEAGNSSTATKRVRVLRYVACKNGRVDRVGWKVKKDSDAIRNVYCKTVNKKRAKREITFTFSGQQLQVVHGKARKGGFAKVIIDGQARKKLNFRTKAAGSGITFRKVRTYGGLGSGTHTVRLVMKKKVKPKAKHHGYLEGFVVRR